MYTVIIYLSVISWSLLISCLISLFGAGFSILSSKKIANNKIKINKIVLITNFLVAELLSDIGFNLSCIINKLYLDSQNKTKL